jgi:hypothetical protein
VQKEQVEEERTARASEQKRGVSDPALASSKKAVKIFGTHPQEK